MQMNSGNSPEHDHSYNGKINMSNKIRKFQFFISLGMLILYSSADFITLSGSYMERIFVLIGIIKLTLISHAMLA